ncbi:hypothetical protein [uncultured Thalassospira sp.]|uniref:hypothetical protein n=1 Tax=uncultured Thalassospira sp. TaxID=404382 RepID=UPI0030D7B389|tara:strand:- start:4929 stop:5756 length:828 start_codon:yes stop_codon:yes gene_type:complete
MKATPILFSAPMVQAIIAGRKTQTRRIIKPQPTPTPEDYTGPTGHWWPSKSHRSMIHIEDEMQKLVGLACDCSPYGRPGDPIYVRETYFQRGHWEPVNGKNTKGGKQKWEFSPESHEIQFVEPAEYRKARDVKDPFTVVWHKRLGRFMPRRYSRITLEITDIRVQRVQEIVSLDAIAEGISEYATAGTTREHGMAWGEVPNGTPDDAVYWLADYSADLPEDADRAITLDPRESFKGLWQAVNGAESWTSNPWVWAVTFKPHTVNVDQFIKEGAAS